MNIVGKNLRKKVQFLETISIYPLISKNLSIFIPQLINKQGLRKTSTKGTYRNAVLRSKTKQLANILQDLYSFYPGPINIECRS